MGVALDGDARREQLAGIAHILGRDARGNRLHALEALASVERFALCARAQIGAAAFALRQRQDGLSKDIVAACAPHYLVKSWNARRTSFERLAFGFVGTGFDAVVDDGRLRQRRLRTGGRPLPRAAWLL